MSAGSLTRLNRQGASQAQIQHVQNLFGRLQQKRDVIDGLMRNVLQFLPQLEIGIERAEEIRNKIYARREQVSQLFEEAERFRESGAVVREEECIPFLKSMDGALNDLGAVIQGEIAQLQVLAARNLRVNHAMAQGEVFGRSVNKITLFIAAAVVVVLTVRSYLRQA